MNKPELIELQRIERKKYTNPAIWTLNSLNASVRKKFQYKLYTYPDAPDGAHDCLIVIGGGKLIDFAKVWRNQKAEMMELVAIPSIWGSGAENSDVAVINNKNEKIVHKDEAFLPDFRSYWPELASSIPEHLKKFGCGDVWSHALEGFVSPLADEALRGKLSHLIKRIVEQESWNDPIWFELSAEACAGQASSGVGLIHGIAHTLEPLLVNAMEHDVFGHARLCSIYAWPVLNLNNSMSDKMRMLFGKYGIDFKIVDEKLRTYFSIDDFNLLLPILEKSWKTIIRHPFTRMNCCLIRQDAFGKICELGRS